MRASSSTLQVKHIFGGVPKLGVPLHGFVGIISGGNFVI